MNETTLQQQLDLAYLAYDQALDDGNQEHMDYWSGQIDALERVLDAELESDEAIYYGDDDLDDEYDDDDYFERDTDY